MLAIELDLFSIGTITISNHTKHVRTSIHIQDLGILELIQNLLN